MPHSPTHIVYNNSDLVLVTGANGHVAQHVVDQLIDLPSGPRIRATVRSAATAQQIKSFYEGKGSAKGRLDIVIIPDIVKPGAFDDAVRGVTHIAHIASPFVINVEDIANDLLKPAMQGTVGLLQSAMGSPTVKAIAVTSSFGSVFDPNQGWRSGYKYSDKDWNPITFEEAASPDLDLNSYPEPWRPTITYCASKTVAERAAWDFYKTHSPHFTLTTILPTYIGGPSILPLTKGVGSLSLSQDLLWKTATATSKLPKPDYPVWVDVRDVAKAHVNSLVTPEAAGKRWILASTTVTYSEIADIIRRTFPSLSPSTEVQKLDYYTIDTSPALSVLGLGSYIDFETTIIDTIQQVMRMV
jgi:nucleoside-diphosphate-sugar epimerase